MIDKYLVQILILLQVLLLLSCDSKSKEISTLLDAKTIEHRGHQYDVVIIEDPQSVHFFWKDDAKNRYKSLANLKAALAAKNKTLNFAMNGGMYLKDGSPQGLYIEQGEQFAKVDTIQNAYGNFYLQPNGIFCINDSTAHVLTTVDFLQSLPEVKYATQSGPMLVIEGHLHDAFNEGSSSTHFRNGVGVRADGKIVFAISNEKINFFDFATLFKEKLNCPNALYLDGFVSRAYIPDLGRKDLDGNFGVIIGLY